MMTPQEADVLLRGARNVPVFKGSLDYLKEVRANCLDADIAAALVRPPRREGG